MTNQIITPNQDTMASVEELRSLTNSAAIACEIVQFKNAIDARDLSSMAFLVREINRAVNDIFHSVK